MSDPAPSTPQSAPAAAVRRALEEALRGQDYEKVTIGKMRQEVAERLGFEPDALDSRKDEIQAIMKEVLNEIEGFPTESPLEDLLAEEEEKTAVQRVYLITVARVLGAKLADGRQYKNLQSVDRKTIGMAVLDAFDNPLTTGAGTTGGRPRAQSEEVESIVTLLVVFRESHRDGSIHFHIVVKLSRPYRFVNVKRTLRIRHLLPSHFSCSHTLLWSSLRYGYVATVRKPDVDDNPWLWTRDWHGFARDQNCVDLFDLCQEPWRPDSWRKRRAAADRDQSDKSGKAARYEKLDLTRFQC